MASVDPREGLFHDAKARSPAGLSPQNSPRFLQPARDSITRSLRSRRARRLSAIAEAVGAGAAAAAAAGAAAAIGDAGAGAAAAAAAGLAGEAGAAAGFSSYPPNRSMLVLPPGRAWIRVDERPDAMLKPRSPEVRVLMVARRAARQLEG